MAIAKIGVIPLNVASRQFQKSGGHLMKRILAITALPFLAACGGSSTFDSYGNEADDLLDTYVLETYTRPDDFPRSDTATYYGVAAGETDSLVAVAGDLTVRVNFAGDTFDGEITNIVNRDDERYSGQIDLDGTIDDTNAPTDFSQITGTMSGEIITPDRLLTDVTGDIAGNFLGAGAPALVISGEGEVDNFEGIEGFSIGGIAER